MPGYHNKIIDKGELGEFSKIKEEFDELQDAHDQGNKILELCELSDLYGAIALYLEKYYPTITMDDIEYMSNKTTQAFMDGTR